MFVRCTSIVRLLLSFNAQLEPPTARSAANTGLHTGDDDSGTLLGAAAFKGHSEIAALLISAHADVDGRSQSGEDASPSRN
jgi:ankyrin repeat protein